MTEDFDYIYRFRHPPGLRGKRLRLIRRRGQAIYIKGPNGTPVLDVEDGGRFVPVEFDDGVRMSVCRSAFVRRKDKAGVAVENKIARGETRLRATGKKKRKAVTNGND